MLLHLCSLFIVNCHLITLARMNNNNNINTCNCYESTKVQTLQHCVSNHCPPVIHIVCVCVHAAMTCSYYKILTVVEMYRKPWLWWAMQPQGIDKKTWLAECNWPKTWLSRMQLAINVTSRMQLANNVTSRMQLANNIFSLTKRFYHNFYILFTD